MHRFFNFFPFLEWISTYSQGKLKGDLAAGVTVAIMMIPQGMAYAMIAGLPPVHGLYAAIVPQIIYALFGTSRQLSVGPVAMDSLLVAAGVSVLAEQGTADYLVLAISLSFFVGFFQFLLGVFKMGFITNLLSKPIISGFTSGAAIIIALNQLRHFLGVEIIKTNQLFVLVKSTIDAISSTHLPTLLLAIFGMIVILVAKRIHQKIPGSLIAILLASLLVFYADLSQMGVSILREIPSSLPPISLSMISFGSWLDLLPLAATLAVIGFVESYTIGKSIENRVKDHSVKPNQELVGLGLSNIIGSLFSSYPVAGSFSRSVINEQSGGRTPLASLFTVSIILCTLLFFTPMFYHLPHGILASIIMVAVYQLIDFKYALILWKQSRSDFILLTFTFGVTIFLGMVPGILTGVTCSILFLLFRNANPHIAQLGRVKGHHEFRNLKRFDDLETWQKLLIVRIDSPLSFINIQGVKDSLWEAIKEKGTVEILIIDAGPISDIDATAASELAEFINELATLQIDLYVCDVIGPVRDIFFRTGIIDSIGTEKLFFSLKEAVLAATGELQVDRSFRTKALQTNVKA